MKSNYLKYSFFLLPIAVLISCQKPSRDNPWDDLAKLNPQEWAPKNLLIEAVSVTERTLTWEYDGDNRIEGFKIDRKHGNGSWVQGYANQSKKSQSFTDTISPDLNSTYHYKVYSYAGTVKSNELEFNTPAAIPTPTDLTLEKINDVSYKLNWNDNAIGESGFIIERKTTGPDFIVLDTIDANMTTYTDTNVFIGKAPINVQYRIKAFVGRFLSDFSESNTIGELSAPDKLVIQKNSVSSVSINWNHNSYGEVSFTIERKQADGDWELIATQSATNFTDQSFLINTDVLYRIAAFVGDFKSDFVSNGFNSQIPVPNNLQIIRNSVFSATLSWLFSSPGIQGFRIYRKIPPEEWTFLSDQTATTYIENDFALNSIITYKVAAYYQVFQSPEVETDFNTQIPAPENLIFTLNSNTSTTLYWQYSISGHDHFQLERKINDEEWSVIASSINPNVFNFTDEDINLEQNNYSYRIRAVANGFFSDYSMILELIPNVSNPATGRTWMDRNLGASRIAQSSTDAEAYGDLYQWGRLTDGHEKRTSGTTSTSSSSNTPGHGNFIVPTNSPSDWRNPQNNNLWQDINGINNPCPNGYRLPTSDEWDAERQSWSSNNAVGAFNSPLKLPLAGFRSNSTGSVNAAGSGGYYYSSTVSGSSSRRLYFGSSSTDIGSYSRSYGFSVRCIKD